MPFPRELRRVPHSLSLSAINASRTPAFLPSLSLCLFPLPCDYRLFSVFFGLILIPIPNTTLISGLISGFCFLFCYPYYSRKYQQ